MPCHSLIFMVMTLINAISCTDKQWNLSASLKRMFDTSHTHSLCSAEAKELVQTISDLIVQTLETEYA